MLVVLVFAAVVGCSSIAAAEEAERPPRKADDSALPARERYPFEFRQVAELNTHRLFSFGEYTPRESGWAYGVGGEAVLRLGSLLSFGAGISASAIRGENTSGDSEGQDVSGWMLQVPLALELGFPNVDWGRFSVAAEIGGTHVSLKNVYYFEEDRGGTFSHGGIFLGLRIGYVHWISDRIGLLVNTGARASEAGSYVFASLGTRVGVSWRF